MPPPVPLKWLSSDNDRLYREADVIVVTVPGSGHPDTVGLINRTSLGLMRVHRPLPGMSMRDAAFWRYSAEFVAKNLDALANGTPLAGVVRNATFLH